MSKSAPKKNLISLTSPDAIKTKTKSFIKSRDIVPSSEVRKSMIATLASSAQLKASSTSNAENSENLSPAQRNSRSSTNTNTTTFPKSQFSPKPTANRKSHFIKSADLENKHCENISPFAFVNNSKLNNSKPSDLLSRASITPPPPPMRNKSPVPLRQPLSPINILTQGSSSPRRMTSVDLNNDLSISNTTFDKSPLRQKATIKPRKTSLDLNIPKRYKLAEPIAKDISPKPEELKLSDNIYLDFQCDEDGDIEVKAAENSSDVLVNSLRDFIDILKTPRSSATSKEIQAEGHESNNIEEDDSNNNNSSQIDEAITGMIDEFNEDMNLFEILDLSSGENRFSCNGMNREGGGASSRRSSRMKINDFCEVSFATPVVSPCPAPPADISPLDTSVEEDDGMTHEGSVDELCIHESEHVQSADVISIKKEECIYEHDAILTPKIVKSHVEIIDIHDSNDCEDFPCEQTLLLEQTCGLQNITPTTTLFAAEKKFQFQESESRELEFADSAPGPVSAPGEGPTLTPALRCSRRESVGLSRRESLDCNTFPSSNLDFVYPFLTKAFFESRVQVELASYVICEDHVKFEIKIKAISLTGEMEGELMLLRRYSDFQKLFDTLIKSGLHAHSKTNEEIEVQVDESNPKLLAFPGKQLIPYWNRWMNDSFLKTRMDRLEEWLQCVFKMISKKQNVFQAARVWIQQSSAVPPLHADDAALEGVENTLHAQSNEIINQLKQAIIDFHNELKNFLMS